MEFMSLKVIGIKVTFKVVLVVGRLAPFYKCYVAKEIFLRRCQKL